MKHITINLKRVNKANKAIALIMIAVMLIVTCYSNYITAYAAEHSGGGVRLDNVKDSIKNIDDLAQWFFTDGEQVMDSTLNSVSLIMTGIGALGNKAALDIAGATALLSDLIGKEDSTQEFTQEELTKASNYFNINVKIGSDNKITFSNDFVNAVRNFITDTFGSGNEYYSYYNPPVLSQFILDKNYYTYDVYTTLIGQINSIQTDLLEVSLEYTWEGKVLSASVREIEDKELYFYKKNWYVGTSNRNLETGIADSNFKERGSFSYEYHWFSNDYIERWLCSRSGKSIRIFHSFDSFKSWRMSSGSSNVYYTNNWYSYDNSVDNSVTVNGDMITNHDWSTINNNYYDKIDNSVKNYYTTNGTAMSNSELQETIEKANEELLAYMEKLIEEIGKGSEEEIINDNKNADKIVDAVSKGAVHVADTIDKNSGNILNLLKEKLGLANSVLVAISDQLLLGFTRVNDNLNNLLGITSTVNAINDMSTAIQQKLDTLIASVDGISKIVEGIKKVTEPEEGSFWADVLKFIGIIGGILAGGALAVAALEALAAMVAEATLVFQPVAALAKTKFPFSIPFDMVLAINILAAEPKAPVFKLPLKIESIGFYQDLVIDLGQFSVVSEVTRTFFTIIFISCLIVLSRKLFLRR